MIPYGKQWIESDDIAAVVEVLQSDWLTTGPKVGEFEAAFAQFVGVKEAVAVSNGTAALHCAMYAAGIGEGDEVIVPTLTFAASANAVVFVGAKPVFADVEADTLLIDPADVQAKITPKTRAIVAVDYGGQPCDYSRLREIASQHNLILIADACHAIGGSYHDQPVGSLADLNTFSLHPVKHITTGEGGMITTDNPQWAQRMRLFRNHGITSDHRMRSQQGTWHYEMVDLGYNYRITDFQCALGLSQLRKLPRWIGRRQEIASVYDRVFANLPTLTPLKVTADVAHAYHLYVVKLNLDKLKADRGEIFTTLREKGIGVNVHYIPVHLHPYYRKQFGTGEGLCPVAEAAYQQILSLPIYPQMSDEQQQNVINTVKQTLSPS